MTYTRNDVYRQTNSFRNSLLHHSTKVEDIGNTVVPRLNVNAYKGDPLMVPILLGFSNDKKPLYKEHRYKLFFNIKVKFFGPFRAFPRKQRSFSLTTLGFIKVRPL